VCPRMALPEFPGRRPWVLVDWGVRYPLGARLQEHPRGCDQADGDGTADPRQHAGRGSELSS
jgi:hypothetical protein